MIKKITFSKTRRRDEILFDHTKIPPGMTYLGGLLIVIRGGWKEGINYHRTLISRKNHPWTSITKKEFLYYLNKK